MGLWSGDKQISPETVIAQAKAASQQVIVKNLYRDPDLVEVQIAYDEPVDPSVVAADTVPEPIDDVVGVDETEVTKTEATKIVETTVAPSAKIVGRTVAATVSNDIKLPDHVAAGFYRAVNHKGQADIIQVLPTSLNANASSRDFYTHEVEGDRWYLIRLDVPSVAASPDLMFLQ